MRDLLSSLLYIDSMMSSFRFFISLALYDIFGERLLLLYYFGFSAVEKICTLGPVNCFGSLR